MTLEEKLKKIIEPVLEEMNLILYELKYEKEDNENYLRIFLEKEHDVMDLDTCVEASEKISLLLDKVSSTSALLSALENANLNIEITDPQLQEYFNNLLGK